MGRFPFLVGKAAASVLTVTATEAGGLLGVLVARMTIHRVDEIPLSDTARAFAGSWVLFVALAMVGILVSAGSSLRGRALGGAVAIVVASFFLNFIALLIDGVSGLRFASPFHYFRPGEILTGSPLVAHLSVLAGLALVALAAGLCWFTPRDLTR